MSGFSCSPAPLLLAAVWMFLLRGRSNALFVPDLSDFRRAFDPGNFGAAVFVPAAVLVLRFLLVFGLVGGWILAGRVLAPPTRITEATRTAASGSLSQRIRLPGPRDEFRELADSFDTMLAQLEAHVAEQRRFAANASHELRTPLAITQAFLDVAGNDADSNTAELIERLRNVNTRAIGLAEALLRPEHGRHSGRSGRDDVRDRALRGSASSSTGWPHQNSSDFHHRTFNHLAERQIVTQHLQDLKL
ncbi:sensor histidine kinase [Nocardia testacea]|uniref:sensor histidine kinase n=1 Tax=Nocardia testacea TaxID=248551 RepID=UPI00247AFA39|nr:HAMP domain-containing sensor histidine kinase [Nocardia testacea]